MTDAPFMIVSMKVLAWILGMLAIAGTLVLAVNYAKARHGLREAAAAVDRDKATLQAREQGVRIDRSDEQAEVDNDEMMLRIRRREVAIAELEGKGIDQAAGNLDRAQARLLLAKEQVRLSGMLAAYGEDEKVARARERLAASEASRGVYAGLVQRDGRFAYAMGVLWLAFGFAAALAFGKK